MERSQIIKLVLLGLLVFCVLLRIQKLNFPITPWEAKEAYTAYSILKIGKDTNNEFPDLLFKTDNNYVSTLGVYTRIPFIHLFDLTEVAVRIPSVLVGIAAIFVFYFLVKELLKNQLYALVTTTLFAFSPLLLQTNIFDFGLSSGVLFILLLVYFYIRKNSFGFLLSGIFAVLSSFLTIPVVATFSILYVLKKDKKFATKALIALLLFLGIIVSSDRQFLNFLSRQSLFYQIAPQRYEYILNRRLDESRSQGSPLLIYGKNINRIVFNKVFYTAREFAKSIIQPLDYETLTQGNPKFFFWEIPLIFLALIFLFKGLAKELRIYFFAVLFTIIFFGPKALVLITPVVAILYFLLIIRFNKPLITLFIVFLASFSYLSFLDIFWYHPEIWLNENDLRQNQIWTTISQKDLSENSLFVTDVLGEPAYYYLYYQKVDPVNFQKTKLMGPIIPPGIQRIEKIQNVSFGSFKYLESDRKKSQIWVGLSEEFEKVVDGIIYKKIEGVEPENKSFGNELWFVKTIF